MPFGLHAVDNAALMFECVDHIRGEHRLALRMVRIGNYVWEKILQKGIRDRPDLLVNFTTDALDAPTTGQPPNGGFREVLDVLPGTGEPIAPERLHVFAADMHFIAVATHVSSDTLILLLW